VGHIRPAGHERVKAALNFALSFFRIVTLGGKLLKIFMPPQTVLF
jgi:hypothetical protein